MTSKKFYALLAVTDLAVLFVATWFGWFPGPITLVLVVLVAVALYSMMRADLLDIAREIASGGPR